MTNLLAIDPATKTGWASEYAYGVWDLSKRKNESDGIKWIRFRAELDEVCKGALINVVAYERPGGRHAGAMIHHSKLVAIIEAYCADNNIEYVGYSSTEIKKKATGKGNASKADVIEAAKTKLGYLGEDDNEADAMWLYQLAQEDLGL